MKKVVCIAVVVSCVTPASAQVPDYCSAVLTERAYNTKESATNTATFLRLRNDVCDQKHESASSAETYARKGGFKLGYGDLAVSLKDNKQTGQRAYNVKNSKFCQSTEQDFQSAFGGNYKEIIAKDAVTAWRECVSTNRTNQLFIEYSTSANGQLLRGTIYMSIRNGPTERKLLGWKAIGGIDGLNCGIGGKTYDLTKDLDDPIEIKQTGTSVLCEKKEDETVIIGFQISSGVVDIEMPSKIEIQNKQYDELEAKLDAEVTKLNGQLKRAAKDAASADATLQTSILATVESKLDELGKGTWTGGAGGGVQKECPFGQVVVGMQYNVATGDNVGSVYDGVWPICRKMR